MISIRSFGNLIGVISNARQQETEDHQVFMEFYRELVKLTPVDIGSEFGRIQVPTKVDKTKRDYLLELNATDCLWWESQINEGARFIEGVAHVQREIWDRLATIAKTQYMTEEQRTRLTHLLLDHGKVEVVK